MIVSSNKMTGTTTIEKIPPPPNINWSAIRSDFPILDETVHGKSLIYFDNAATSQKPRAVIQAITDYYTHSNANVHRGIHELSNRSTALYEGARARAAEFLKAQSSNEIVFTRGTTESINLVASTWGRQNLKAGDRICLTQMEHHSNIVPWQILSQELGFHIDYIPITGADGLLNLEALEKLLRHSPKLLAFTHISNTLGTINPVREICQMAARAGTITLVDGAQSGGHVEVDVLSLGCDFYVMSGHKACGPTGIGLLYGRQSLLESLPPYQGGGEMITQVTFEKPTFNVSPHRFEAGTPNIEGAAGLAAALDYLDTIGRSAIAQHDLDLTLYALERFSELPGIRIYGPRNIRGSVVSFCFDDIHAHDLVTFADARGLALRSGHHCNQPLMSTLGIAATARASFYFYNTRNEVDQAFDILNHVCRFLRQ